MNPSFLHLIIIRDVSKKENQNQWPKMIGYQENAACHCHCCKHGPSSYVDNYVMTSPCSRLHIQSCSVTSQMCLKCWRNCQFCPRWPHSKVTSLSPHGSVCPSLCHCLISQTQFGFECQHGKALTLTLVMLVNSNCALLWTCMMNIYMYIESWRTFYNTFWTVIWQCRGWCMGMLLMRHLNWCPSPSSWLITWTSEQTAWRILYSRNILWDTNFFNFCEQTILCENWCPQKFLFTKILLDTCNGTNLWLFEQLICENKIGIILFWQEFQRFEKICVHENFTLYSSITAHVHILYICVIHVHWITLCDMWNVK